MTTSQVLEDVLILPPNDESFELCSKRLHNDQLVAFPTETVYGLGANALSNTAVMKIFEMKERPANDPLIVHVSDPASALPCVTLASTVLQDLFRILTDEFWPGPLTLVLPADPRVPKAVTAGGDTVGVRCPAHPVARRLITQSKLPLAAPSANKFGHVSPTQPSHVQADFQGEDLAVLDGDTCRVGIESTVALVRPDGVTVLRRGGVSPSDIREALMRGGFLDIKVDVLAVSKSDAAPTLSAPGQLLRHYAPSVPARLLMRAVPTMPGTVPVNPPPGVLGRVALLDVGGRGRLLLSELGLTPAAHRDLSVSGSVEKVSRCLFQALRWVETLDIDSVLLVPPHPFFLEGKGEGMAASVFDRMFRACSGCVWVVEK
eukprot:gnl/Dysnectes_brevis/3582_a4556_786.p1 GENE.gnl/Dysnectes_brevis/3582_a4556_786~~gnl/Dysnectes_brevis/3582_a4556_786.p1  ORF type:complete len:375 (-),score=105.75 gnl/Dysnectes_brevis/3582_a4556_786:50-1174(-)